MQNVTKVPKVQGFVRGVINLRGKVIPVIDLRAKFNMEDREDTEKTCIIVIQIDKAEVSFTMGIIIDEVKEVLDITAEQIEETPAFGSGIDTSFILGMGKVGDDVKMLLDIEKVLTTEDVQQLSVVN